MLRSDTMHFYIPNWQCILDVSPESTVNSSQCIPEVHYVKDALQIRDVEVHCVRPQQLVSIPFLGIPNYTCFFSKELFSYLLYSKPFMLFSKNQGNNPKAVAGLQEPF